ncbi:MAG: hypothetical protein K0R84_370 [Clostridia bacterium]|nr:hypothetical protein [Clostridia bacterium]
MNIKIGYYPVLDAALLIRQIFSVERFKPFSPVVEAIDSRLSATEKQAINSIAALTEDWLDVIKSLIDVTMQGVSSPEELFIKIRKTPKCVFGPQGKEEMAKLLSDIWYNHCLIEVSKYSNQIHMKAEELSKLPSAAEVVDYILSLSDRIERVEKDTLKFNIKPDLSVKLNDIEDIIVMPSVFSSRNVTFWYSGRTFLFYIAVDSRVMSLEEPSDMLLLRTLAFNDKTRLKMLKALSMSALSVNDLADKLNVNASTVSRHFKVFKDTGFVDIQSQDGNSVYYSINEREIKKSMQSVYDYIFGGDLK